MLLDWKKYLQYAVLSHSTKEFRARLKSSHALGNSSPVSRDCPVV